MWTLSQRSLLLLCLVTFFAGLGTQAITDSDEAYYAEASREMVERGDWLTPQFNYENRWQKPVLYYWLTAATYLVTGPTEFAARFWSALSGVGLTLLAWVMGRQERQSADAAPAPNSVEGWLSGAIVATSFGYFAMARAALPDLPLTFCITLTIVATLRALDLSRTSSASTWWAVSGLGAGLGFLMKGPVALAIPAVVLLPIAWREWRTVRMEPRGIAVAGVVFAIIGLPWYVVMWFTHGEAYLQSFFVGDNLERFTTERFNDARPFWFYVPVLLGGMMPWSVYLVAVTGAGITGLLKRTLRLDRGQWRLLLWAVMPLLFYTVSIGKQPRYILPVLPPLAALLARSLASRIQQGAAGRTSLLSAGTWITAAMYGAFAFLFIRMGPLLVSAYPAARWIAPLLALCGAVGFAWIAAAGAWRRLPAVGAIAATLLLLAVQFGALAGRRPEAVEEMAMLVRAQRTGNETIGVYGAFARNLGFYTGTPRTEIFGPDQARDFLGSPERVLLILRSDDVKAVEAVTGTPVHVLGRVEYWNTANVRLRTLLRPDPAEEIETIALISNR